MQSVRMEEHPAVNNCSIETSHIEKPVTYQPRVTRNDVEEAVKEDVKLLDLIRSV